MAQLRYETNQPITPEQFIALLEASTLSERRPVDDWRCIEGMLDNANLTVTAWDQGKLVGVARSVTDRHYCCYVSDLAVDVIYQKQGIGKGLLQETRKQLEPTCMVLLLSAPAAVDYYPRIGFTRHPQAFLLKPDEEIL